MILGKGINDLDYKVTRLVDKVIKGVSKKVHTIVCPYYYLWKSLFQRCYGKVSKRVARNYKGVYICDDWLLCSNFKSWMETQHWEGMELDKDILFPGNKVYSPDTCCFVPPKVNTFLLMSENSRGEYPIGVTKGYVSPTGVVYYMARGLEGLSYLGLFSTPMEAHKAWQISKLTVFDRIIDLCKTYEKLDVRVIPAIIRLKEGLEEDIEKGIETTNYHWKENK